jgi:2-octaprenylphenol hydroxylase
MRIFRHLGVWEAMAARRVSPLREMHVWDATGPGSIHFDSAEIGEPLLGHIIENRVMQCALLERLKQREAIDWLCPQSVTALRREGELMHLQLESGVELHCELVVGADGSQSHIRAMSGIQTHGWEYRQRAVVANIRTEKHHNETAWQRFMPDGPLAFLPLTDGLCSIVWTTSPERADALLALDDAAFLEALQQAFGERLGRMLETGPRVGFELRMLHATQYVQPGVAIIGDAAHTIHPLAGQGVNLGLTDAAALAEVLRDALAAHRAPGSIAVLRRYERWRKGDIVTMIAAMEGFKRLFGSRVEPLRWLRNLGLVGTNLMVPVKNRIMRYAMGLQGDLPRLARRG